MCTSKNPEFTRTSRKEWIERARPLIARLSGCRTLDVKVIRTIPYSKKTPAEGFTVLLRAKTKLWTITVYDENFSISPADELNIEANAG